MSFPLDLFRLDGRTALVTGGSGGLGAVFVRALAGVGADVALLGRRVDVAREVAAPIAAETGRRIIALEADVTNQEQVRAAMAEVRATWGRLDILINSAGINIRKPSLEFSLEDWQRVVDVSLTGSFICSQAAAPLMIEQGWPHHQHWLDACAGRAQ